MKKPILIYFFLVLLLFSLILLRLTTVRKNDKAEIKLNVLNKLSGKCEEMNIDDYVYHVLCMEMPAYFEDEALKAQAVAIRTYAYKKKNYGAQGHDGADVCTDSAHCMAFMDDAEAKKRWKDNYDVNKKKYENAVKSTKGKIIIYNNEPISAVFHAISSGKTENSRDVWGGDLPYLVNSESTVDKNVKGYETTVFVSGEDFKEKTGIDYHKGIFKEPVRSSAGGVINIEMDGKFYKGTEIRSMFNLRSSNFETVQEEGGVKFIVYGYGHGVGMSQHGANEYAKQGLNYKDILAHYYRDTAIEDI